jgi:hypothetical protein
MMKRKPWLFCFAFFVLKGFSQALSVVKPVGGRAIEPATKEQEGRKSNVGNRLPLYQVFNSDGMLTSSGKIIKQKHYHFTQSL